MNVLLTGSNGFLGSLLYKELKKIYYVERLSRKNSDINVDLSLSIPVFSKNYDLVIHSAGKAHYIPKNISESCEFFNTNVTGTENLLNALVKNKLPKYFVFISSVSVYGQSEGALINEKFPLMATDPYGKSKIEAENIITEWCREYNVVCTILRLPLIVDINAPGNLKSMINSIRSGYYFNVAGGFAKKSMILPFDIAKYIPIACKIGGIYNLTDSYNPSFKELSQLIATKFQKKYVFNLPYWVALILANFGDLVGDRFPINTLKLKKICATLTFDDTLAKQTFDWNPTPVLKGLKF